MVLPLNDENLGRRLTPYVTWALIAVNILVWLYELAAGQGFINGYSTVPYEITHGVDLVGARDVTIGGQTVAIQEAPGPSPIWLTLLTSMFMHGGWLHIGGNMLYLWIFGDNIEDLMGHWKYVAFYLICGLAASAAQIAAAPDSVIPNLGASGAIAGVLGAYIVKFPKNKVRVLVGRFVATWPALAVIGLWIVLQFISQVSTGAGEATGVAYMAHIGGFGAGVILAFLFGGRPAAAATR